MKRWAQGKATELVLSATHLWFPGYEADAPPIANITEQMVKAFSICRRLKKYSQVPNYTNLIGKFSIYLLCKYKTYINLDFIFKGLYER